MNENISIKRGGVIGLGKIGGGVAVCLARAGRLASVYDVRLNAADELEGLPKCVNSPADVARSCDVVLIAVMNAAQIRQVLVGPEGVFAGAHRHTTVVVLSTVAMDDWRELMEMAAKAKIRLLDCGVTSGPASAQGGLICLVGGTNEDLANVAPVLNSFSRRVLHMGPPGAGMAAKIARNIIVYATWRAGYESEQLALAAGVDISKLAEAIDLSAEDVEGATMWMKRPSADSGPDAKALRERVLEFLEKDLDAACKLASDLNVAIPVANITLRTGPAVLGLASQQ